MSSVVHATFALERTYPAATAQVFAAWASQEAKSHWFGGDDAFSDGTHTLDFRVGGRESLAGSMRNGGTVSYDAVYQDIIENERIVTSYEMLMNGARISVSLATVEFSPVPGGTRLTLTEQGVFLDGLDTAEQREEGTGELLDNLGRHLGGSS